MYVLPCKGSVGRSEDECRFLWLSPCGESDGDVVDYPQAIEVFGRAPGFHRRFRHAPNALFRRAKKDARGVETRKRVKRTLLELCCSPTSLVCDPKLTDGHTRLVRLTEEQAMTTQGGFAYALDFVRVGRTRVA